MRNKIQDVRNLLIEAMEELLHPDPESKFDTDKAKALAQLGAVVIESAKVEFQAIAAAIKYGFKPEATGFISAESQKQLE